MAQATATPDAIKALYIDIDGTLLIPCPGAGEVSPYSLFDVLKKAAVEQRRMDPAEAEGRIERVRKRRKYWQWTDFIAALKLSPPEFWDFALAMERDVWQLAEPEIPAILTALKEAGFHLYITSNNPNSGILHKLRLMGLGDMHGAPLFSQLLGFSEMQAHKWESEYWLKTFAQTGWSATETATIGDSVKDDFSTPHLAGVRRSYLIERQRDLRDDSDQHLIFVQHFQEIADHLLTGKRPASATT